MSGIFGYDNVEYSREISDEDGARDFWGVLNIKMRRIQKGEASDFGNDRNYRTAEWIWRAADTESGYGDSGLDFTAGL